MSAECLRKIFLAHYRLSICAPYHHLREEIIWVEGIHSDRRLWVHLHRGALHHTWLSINTWLSRLSVQVIFQHYLLLVETVFSVYTADFNN
jgi:hypothetical protein